MVKDHSDSKKENLLSPHGLLFPISSKGSFIYASSYRQDNTYQGLCYTSCRALAGMRNSSMGLPHEGSIRRPIAPWANALTTELHLAPKNGFKPCWTCPVLEYSNIHGNSSRYTTLPANVCKTPDALNDN